MGKKPYRRRRKFGNYLKGDIKSTLEIGALAAVTLISVAATETVIEKTRVSSVDAIWSLADITAVVDDGPVMCGLAHSDYTDAEIEQWIENAGSWNAGDKINQEIAKRFIRKIGVFDAPFGDANSPAIISVLNDGLPIKTRLNWSLVTGQTLKFWVYNMGSSALTDGGVMNVNGHANLFLS